MSDITLSAGVRQNLLSLQNTADLMSQTQNRLATGKKVNSALDNPTNFFTSSSLQSRSNDLSSLLDSMSNGIKTLEQADNGLKSITNTVESMQSTLRQARQDKTFQTQSYSIDEQDIDRTAVQTLNFSGGAVGQTPVEVDLNTTYDVNPTQAEVTAAGAYAAPDASTAGTFTIASGDLTNDSEFAGGDELSFDIEVDGGGTETITITDAMVNAAGNNNGVIDDVDELVEVVNAAIADNGNVNATASNDGGDFVLSSDTTGDTSSITISNVVANGPDVNEAGLDQGTSAAGENADTLEITVNDVTITLNGDDHGTADDAAQHITDELAANDVDVTAEADGNEIDLLGLADGSNDVTVTAGADADAVFGASFTTTAGEEGEGGAVQTVDQLVNTINEHADLQGKIRASNDDGNLRITNLSTQDLTVTGVNNNNDIDGGTGDNTVGGNDVRASLSSQFNELRDQLDKTSDDASFNGINLLLGDKLTLTFNETGTSSIDIQVPGGDAINSDYLNIANLQESDFDSDADIDDLLDTMKSALDTLRSQSSTFGSNLSIVENRTEFTKSMMNTLQTGADNLVLADTNEEGANMLALQTRQQLSSTALSMASQSDQAVLRLF